MDSIKIWQMYSSLLETSDILSHSLRLVGWLFIKGLAMLMNGIEGVVDTVLKFSNFFMTKEVQDFFLFFRPFLWILLGISICVVGYQLMFNRIREKSNLSVNILFAIGVIVLIPSLMMKLNGLMLDGVGAIGFTGEKSMANQIIKENITDFSYLDKIGFGGNGNRISSDEIMNIRITEVLDPKEVKNDVLKNTFSHNPETGKLEMTEIKNGFFDVWDDGYYRYGWNFWVMAITLLVTSGVLVLTSVKLARIIFELAFHQLFAMLVAVTDISSGQKTKEIIKTIISSFVVVVVIMMLLKLYMYFSAWLSAQEMGAVAKIVFLLGASWAVIDGPNIVEKVLGIDAGIQSGWKAVTGTYAAAKGLSSLGKMGTKVAGKTMGAAGDVAQVGMVGAAMTGGSVQGLYNQLASGNKGMNQSSSENTGNNENQMTSEETNKNTGVSQSMNDNKTIQEEMNKNNSSTTLNTDSTNTHEDMNKGNSSSQSTNDNQGMHEEKNKNSMESQTDNVGKHIPTIQDEMETTSSVPKAQGTSAENPNRNSTLKDSPSSLLNEMGKGDNPLRNTNIGNRMSERKNGVVGWANNTKTLTTDSFNYGYRTGQTLGEKIQSKPNHTKASGHSARKRIVTNDSINKRK